MADPGRIARIDETLVEIEEWLFARRKKALPIGTLVKAELLLKAFRQHPLEDSGDDNVRHD